MNARFRPRPLVVVLAAFSALMLAAGCTAGTTDSSGGEGGGKGPRVRIALGVDASYAPLYLAKEEGLFEKAGLNVELMQVEGGPAAAESVVAGTAQIALNADSSALPLMASSGGLRALGVFQESDRYLKVVLRDGVDRPQQIKTMASIQGIGLYATHAYLRHHGIDPASIKIVQSSPPEIPGILARGSVDGYILYEPWAAKGEADGGHITARTGDFGIGYAQWVLAGTAWLESNRELAGKIFKVIADADSRVTKDPEAAARATQKQVRLPADQTERVLPEITFRARGFTPEDLASARRLVDFLLQQKLIKKAPDLDTVLLKGWYEKYAGAGGGTGG
ncbi:ABC transporter substrate-binding protein [Actinomadura sp. KC345]|uniref:ABC transporter substrate-binding protein n=1 Tax=Actinomadura sp. KC345 TaxID=2530371 RepID=UPI001A9CD4A7|nr:ABC transporter substrate-binding protein [Actinomadura sp. KC345]